MTRRVFMLLQRALRGRAALSRPAALPGIAQLGVVLLGMASVAMHPAAAAAALDTAPRRIVSLNMCTDELVLRLAPLSHIASVSWLSQDPHTANTAALASRVKANHGLAEEVMPLDPDLVIAGTFTSRMAVALLKHTGVRVVEFGIPSDIDGVRAQIRAMAALLHEQARGDALVASMDRDLAAVPQDAASPRLTALVFNPNGATAGAGSLVDDIIKRAGLENAAAHLELDNYQQVPLETVVGQSVDLLIVSASRDGPPSLATEMLHHPVLARLAPKTHIVVMPSRLWNCAGPAVVGAIARLKAAADEIRRERVTP